MTGETYSHHSLRSIEPLFKASGRPAIEPVLFLKIELLMFHDCSHTKSDRSTVLFDGKRSCLRKELRPSKSLDGDRMAITCFVWVRLGIRV